ncbi:hypothetical protein [Actinoplanes sp. NBRC 101535]|uniref:hypothetical protein n=1 Tax=Actinoplanes sp. NBRC 101535 TaxID=3032196 RepID=UPI0024A06568|nr:hypothetical protein [Actinoplanes sp. NBRC 101535]GLY08615.1 hypothetical protein Acsp01_89940 [Actinoplanes sp. NBRC 101535]
MNARRFDHRLSRVSVRLVLVLRRITGRTDLSVVRAYLCPWCDLWVAPRRFDRIHMACRECVRSLGRPTRLGRGWRGCR